MPGKFRLAEVVPAALLVLGLFSSSFFLAEAAAQHHASKAQFALRHLGGFLANVSETATRPPVPGAPDVKGLTQELLDTAFRLAKDYPGRVEPLYVIGLVHQRTGRGAEACEYWRKCLDLNPRYADAYLGLAEVSFDKGEYEQTLALYQKGLSIYNHDPEIPINIGKTLIFLGRCDEAVRVLEQHLIEYPQAAPAHIYLGKAHLLEKQHEKAKSHYEKALQYDPNDEKAHYGLAIVYAKLGDEEKSDEHRRRFASLKSGSLSNLNERFRTYDDVRLVRRNAAFVYLKIGICHEICGNRAKAEEFLNLVEMDDWDKATGVFEKLYGRYEGREENDPNAFRLQNEIGLRRVSLDILETLAIQNQGRPAMGLRLNEIKNNKRYADQLYSLVPADSNTVEELPVMMEYKPDLKVLVIKDISIKRMWKEQYDQVKAMSTFRQENGQSQSLAAVHFNPANILKRVNFELVETEQDTADANEPEQSETET